MRISEAERSDLYTGFVEVFGPKRAETLMGAIRIDEVDEVATKTDLAMLRADLMGEIGTVRVDLAELRAEFKSDLTRLSFILVAGFLGIIATLIGVGLFA